MMAEHETRMGKQIVERQRLLAERETCNGVKVLLTYRKGKCSTLIGNMGIL